MAFKLIAPLDLGTFSYISADDESVDIDAEGFTAKWKAYRDGKADPPLKPGSQKPTEWTINPKHPAKLTSYLKGVAAKHGNIAYFVAMAAVSIEEVSNLANAEGKPYKLRFVMEDGYRSICEEQLDEIGVDFLYEVGVVVQDKQNPS